MSYRELKAGAKVADKFMFGNFLPVLIMYILNQLIKN